MKTFYGAPEDDLENLVRQNGGVPPEEGDELCEGHQLHYIWEDGRWQ